MADRQEHTPGTRAPVTGHYEELNVFGSPTGKVEHVQDMTSRWNVGSGHTRAAFSTCVDDRGCRPVATLVVNMERIAIAAGFFIGMA